jgi:predicted ribonuclease toxin of YeeF-YezG toxin-antitoxin module
MYHPELHNSRNNAIVVGHVYNQQVVSRNFTLISEMIEETLPVKDITHKLQEFFPNYLSEIEDITKTKLSKQQKKILHAYISKNHILKLDSSQTNKHRHNFSSKRKNNCIRSWERHNRRSWPRYEKNVRINGKIIRRKNSYYDAHHIIENTYNGPHKWWNIHPASYTEHHSKIHAQGGYAQQIFE